MHTLQPERTSARATVADQQAIDWTCFKPFTSHFLGVSTFDASDTDQVRRYMDWDLFFRKWEFPLPFPDVLDDVHWGPPARALYTDARARLDELVGDNLRPEVVFGVWRASARGDQVLVETTGGTTVGLSFPRIQVSDSRSYCVADFIKPAMALRVGESDYLGGYALRLGTDVDRPAGQPATGQHDYRSLLTADLCELYRSALVDYLHYRLRRFIWAYCDDDDLSNEKVLTGTHQGIRVDVGGPECPGQTLQAQLLKQLGVDAWEDAGAFHLPGDRPSRVSSGFFLAHPQSRNLLSPFTGADRTPCLCP
ncbi:vitamin B12 dependent-methionine synthase activation domain-containing protein [Spirosoma utsteinense]|uniref:Cobalamin-dependent methionine synthase I n=1 Tax=Spirosoma utsteinense TaxID=2585773 RepID=A0ABR6VZM4_9BACT|nr:vitamin B12 dependent-methionine synthase activation domain-containing protein [Spirosoma utsteinense]MBC3789088.1 cobalamin-dependent methionine synthase I [Spirosoma utsteinense]MBC3789786.1 cobalamin-dependent methionine synthase I [Spirosoma utsteinense]